jgi:hypothetical protein
VTAVKCSYCYARAVVAIKTGGRDSVRGINSTVYYEPDAAPRGSEPLCRDHGLGILGSLIDILS